MAASPSPTRRPKSATIALAVAGLLALGAIGAAIFKSGDADAVPNNVSANAPAASAGSMEEMIAAMQERLRQDPDNHEGWYLLGMSFRESGRFQEGVQAFRRAVELQPRNADYAAYLGETLLLAGGGTIPPEAPNLFRRALDLQPGHPQARYYLATIKDLGGDHRGAIDDLVALVRDAPAGAPWEAQVRGAIEAIGRENNIDVAGRLPPPRAAPPSPATAAIPGPSREQLEAARAIPPSEQDEMVRGMVERLAARLRQNPRDADGWIRLMRSRMVLNDRAAAGEALRSGLGAFANDPAAQGRLRAAARELGVPGGS